MEVVKFLKTLSNKGRLDVFKAISETCSDCDELKGLKNGNCVTSISKKLNLPQPTVSNYVKALVKAGLVTKKRNGKNIYFFTKNEVRSVVKLIENI